MGSFRIGFWQKECGLNKTEEEVVRCIASHGYRRIYKYANAFGDQVKHTDYKCIDQIDSEEEKNLLYYQNQTVFNLVLVYDDGKIMNCDGY